VPGFLYRKSLANVSGSRKWDANGAGCRRSTKRRRRFFLMTRSAYTATIPQARGHIYFQDGGGRSNPFPEAVARIRRTHKWTHQLYSSIRRQAKYLVEVLMLMMIRRPLLWACAALASAAISFGALIFWPDPHFALSLHAGKIIVASEDPISPAGESVFFATVGDCWNAPRSKLNRANAASTLQTRTGDNGHFSSRALMPGASPTPTLLGARCP
jgi:hypothetical protein